MVCPASRARPAGYHLATRANAGDLAHALRLGVRAPGEGALQLDRRDLLGALAQIVLLLARYGEEYDLVHGDLKATNILADVRHAGEEVARILPVEQGDGRRGLLRLDDQRLVLHLSDFGCSSVTFPARSANASRRYRYYPAPPTGPVVPRIGSDHGSTATYRLPRRLPKPLLYLGMRHAPRVTYPGLDLYSLMISLALEAPYHEAFAVDGCLASAWRCLWPPSEHEAILADIERVRTEHPPQRRGGIAMLLRLLRGRVLYGDAVNRLKTHLVSELLDSGLASWSEPEDLELR